MLVGVFLAAFGVSFSIKAKIGTTPISVCPAVFSQPLHITTGTALWIMFAFFLIVQIIILKREFPPFQLLQLAISFLFGFSTDLGGVILGILPDEAIWQQIIYCAMGIILLSTGVYIQLKADLLMLSPDAILKVISQKYNKEYSKLKIIMDCTMVTIAVIGSLIIYKKLVHVGIGTVAGAIFVGMTIGKLKTFKGLNRLLDKALGTNEEATHEAH